MKLMGIDSDILGIPETKYESGVTMVSSKFTRIVRDLGEHIRIEVSNEGDRFPSDGEAADSNVQLLQAGEQAERSTSGKKEKEKSDDVEMVDLHCGLMLAQKKIGM